MPIKGQFVIVYWKEIEQRKKTFKFRKWGGQEGEGESEGEGRDELKL